MFDPPIEYQKSLFFVSAIPNFLKGHSNKSLAIGQVSYCLLYRYAARGHCTGVEKEGLLMQIGHDRQGFHKPFAAVKLS